jgi:hypothetical protein
MQLQAVEIYCFGCEQTRGVPHSRRVRCCAAGCLECAVSPGKEDAGGEGRGARGRDGGCAGVASPASGESNQTESGIQHGSTFGRLGTISATAIEDRDKSFSVQFSRPKQELSLFSSHLR